VEHKQAKRGSEKLMAAWQARALSEDSVQEIAKALDASPAAVMAASVVGGTHATGVSLSLAYEGDDIPRCGNDIVFWLRWHLTHGAGPVRPPRILINGTPRPDLVRLQLDFGQVGDPGPVPGGFHRGGFDGGGGLAGG
jgi:hypothetical protein